MIVPKKSPKRAKIPNDSSMKPIKDLFIRINKIPIKKQSRPLILLGLVKKFIVLRGPIMRTNPIMKSKLPKAKKPESKKVIIPKKKKKIPPAVKPTPNSIVSSEKVNRASAT